MSRRKGVAPRYDAALLGLGGVLEELSGRQGKSFLSQLGGGLGGYRGVGGQANPGIHGKAPCHRVCFRVGLSKGQGKRVTLLVDSEAIEAAIVKGTSSAADHLDLIAILWDVVTDWDVALFVSRVPTDSNPSDEASRGRFESLESRGACWVDTALSRFALSRARWHVELRHKACRNEQNMPASTVAH